MRKIIFSLFISLVAISSHCYADNLEIVAGLDEKKDLPVINENFRQKDIEIKSIDSRVSTLEATPSVSAATQAQMEATASTTTYASPGRTQYHPGVSKAWAMWNGATAGTNSPTIGYNVASVAKTGTSSWTINFSTAFSTANYAFACSALSPAGGTCACGVLAGTTPTTSALQLEAATINNNNCESTRLSVMVFGDQ